MAVQFMYFARSSRAEYPSLREPRAEKTEALLANSGATATTTRFWNMKQEAESQED